MAVDNDAGSLLTLRLLGPLAVLQDGLAVTLPASRKVRALLGYLAMTPQPVTRSQLCDLLWDGPNDPRGELRWCLSRIRAAIDPKTPGDRPQGPSRIETQDDSLRLRLDGCSVDALDAAASVADDLNRLPLAELQRRAALFAGEFLEGLDADRMPAFNTWLMAQRRRLRGLRVTLIERIVALSETDAATALPWLEQWQQLVPFDLRVHEKLLQALARQGRFAEGEAHLQAAMRLFQSEDLEQRPLREAWRAARQQSQPQPDQCLEAAAALPPQPDAPAAEPARRASIAVMPFRDGDLGSLQAGRRASYRTPRNTGDWLTTDVIVRLARLRSLLVISQGTTLALRDRWMAPEDAARLLNVDYVVNGSLCRTHHRLVITVELAETRSGRILWTEAFDHRAEDALLAFDEIGARIADRITHEVDAAERQRAILKPPNSLTAWEAYHRGMWHFYHFDRVENRKAQQCFEAALQLDPTFSRAHAGLSFAHYQNAFQGWADRAGESERAYARASQGLMADDRDPAVHEVMGRALWLRGELDSALTELETAIDLSPNFVPGHYTLSFFHSLEGDPQAAIMASDHSRQISPFDPLMFAMLATRAVALLRLKRFDEAADWSLRAAARPNAHLHVQALSAYALGLADRLPEARTRLEQVRARWPDYTVETYLAAMRLAPEGAAMVRKVAQRLDA
jgi:DNA-binding SARP family transcriptional activator/TolB-like protein